MKSPSGSLVDLVPNPSPQSAGRAYRARLVLAALATSAVLLGCGGSELASYQTSPISSEKSITLQWDPPVANEDGSALTDLAGYRLYYGLRSTNYEYVLDIKDPQATTAAIQLPWPGAWYISAKSYRSNGIESSLSEEIMYQHDIL